MNELAATCKATNVFLWNNLINMTQQCTKPVSKSEVDI